MRKQTAYSDEDSNDATAGAANSWKIDQNVRILTITAVWRKNARIGLLMVECRAASDFNVFHNDSTVQTGVVNVQQLAGRTRIPFVVDHT